MVDEKKNWLDLYCQKKGNSKGRSFNKAKSRRQELLERQPQQKKASSTTKSSSSAAAAAITYDETMERDVRIMDQERQQARANDFGSLVDEALKKKKG